LGPFLPVPRGEFAMAARRGLSYGHIPQWITVSDSAGAKIQRLDYFLPWSLPR